MTKLKFSSPRKIPNIKIKATVLEGPLFPIEKINDEEFEWLTYWMFKTEIEEGDWNGRFDKIGLMNATGDLGRDCVLYKNGKETGVIQCKHSSTGALLPVDLFLKELLKFVMYSIQFPDKLKIYDGYEYFIACSGKFNEDCQVLIEDYKSSVLDHDKLENYFNAVRKKYVSLNSLKFKIVKSELFKKLLMLNVSPLNVHDLSNILHKAYQKTTIQAFFALKYVVDEVLLRPIEKRLESIESTLGERNISLPISRPKEIKDVDNYIERSTYKSSEEIAISLIMGDQKKNTLVDRILNEQYIALIGWGLTGKTQELQHAASVLSSQNYHYHVFLISLDKYNSQDFKSSIPDLDRIPQENVVVLLDGLDEVVPSYYSDCILDIKNFINDYPLVKVIVSSRNNSYSSSTDEAIGTLPGFNIVKISGLSSKDIDTYLRGIDNFNVDGFYKKVNRGKLTDLLSTPYYLIEFSKKYRETGEVFKSKGELFEDLIVKGIQYDVQRLNSPKAYELSKKLRSALEKLSFVQELQGKNYFTYDDLLRIFPDTETIELVKAAGRLIKGSEDTILGTWSFVHHNFQEYLAACILAKQDYDKIQQVLTFEYSKIIIKGSFVHTISFLIGMLKPAPIKLKLVDLILQTQQELFLRFEPDQLDDNFRFDILKRIFEQHSQQQKRFNTNKFEIRDVARFSQSIQSVSFITEQIEQPANDCSLMNALEIITLFDIHKYPSIKLRLKHALNICVLSSNDFIKFLSVKALLEHYKLSPGEFKVIFGLLSNQTDSHLRFLLFYAFYQQGYQNHYHGYIVREISVLACEERKSYSYSSTITRLAEEYYHLNECLKLFTTRSSLMSMLMAIQADFTDLNYSTYFKDFIKTALVLAVNFVSDMVIRQKVDDILVKYVLTNSDRLDALLDYYIQTDQKCRITEVLLNHFKKLDMMLVPSLVRLSDKSSVTYIANEITSGNIDMSGADSFQWRLERIDPELMKLFNEILNKKFTFPLPIKINYEELNKKNIQLKAEVIFNKEKFLIEIDAFFAIICNNFNISTRYS